LSLINNILDLASIESGHLVLEPEPVNLHDLLSSVLTLTRERMRKKNQFLDFDCPIEIGSIMADGRRLKQALFNIMSNSVKFTPDGGSITVSARRVDDRVMLTFTDTGIGISDADQSRIFQNFEGTSQDARQAGAGVGLGLSLVRNFIELHDGKVELESEEGVGTKVTCTLPARDVEESLQPKSELH
jgi:signal transduction histidine kinase